MSNYKLGWIKDKEDERDFLFVPDKQLIQKLPSIVDLGPLCPPGFYQGNLGSCSGCAAAFAFWFDLLRQKLPDFVPAVLYLYYFTREREGTANEDAGATLRDEMKTLNTRGVCPDTFWPYDIGKFAVRPPQSATIAARGHKSLKYSRVAQDLNHMKACLASGLPFVFGINVYQSFMNATDGNIPMPQTGEQLLGGHALVCTGYNDATQCFSFKNSWGSSWGNNGFGTIPYAYLLSSEASDLWEVETVVSQTGLLAAIEAIKDNVMLSIAEKLHLHEQVAI